MPHADEALRVVLEKFRAAPRSEAFIELAAALLSRGHAAEALRVAEHGLQFSPASADGRCERAAALLALGRPRVAYVELRRALAVAPEHRRGLRLLGQAYKEAGAPARAAELLSRRLGSSELAPTSVAFPAPAVAAPPAPLVQAEAQALPPNFFSSLTVDLGLGSAVPEAPVRRVEITQVIRRKGFTRPPRSASELAAIDGPIVETTQPGQIVESETAEPPPLDSPELAPLFDLADEPLFPDASSFSVRPVVTLDLGVAPRPVEPMGPDHETMVETIGPNDVETVPPWNRPTEDSPPWDSQATSSPPLFAGSMETPASARPTAPAFPSSGFPSSAFPSSAFPSSAFPSSGFPSSGFPSSGFPSSGLPSQAASPSLSSSGLGVATVERARVVEGRIEVVDPEPSQARRLLATLAVLAMVLYLAALALAGLGPLGAWLGLSSQPATGEPKIDAPR